MPEPLTPTIVAIFQLGGQNATDQDTNRQCALGCSVGEEQSDGL